MACPRNAVFAENGVVAWDGVTGLRLAHNRLFGASQVAVFLDGSSAALEANTWLDNDHDILQQHCGADLSLLSDDALDGVPTWERSPEGDVLVDYSLQFNTLYVPEEEPLE